MLMESAVSADLRAIRKEMTRQESEMRNLLRTNTWRPLCDIAVDWILILAAVWIFHHGSAWLLPLALLLVGSRGRSLGNILHDAAHRNLSRNPRLNDAIAQLTICPLLLTDLALYREAHHRHHRYLGEPGRDPDLIQPAGDPSRPWVVTYLATLLQPRNWWSALSGNLSARVPPGRLAGQLLWWVVLLGLMGAAGGWRLAGSFVLLWFAGSATAFHALTVFRELCDHFGLRPGGIFSYTRDIDTTSPLRWLVHPRNDGFHLTHHLMPAVPYYRLPRAHALFRDTAVYRRHACICDGYFIGTGAVISSGPAMQPAV